MSEIKVKYFELQQHSTVQQRARFEQNIEDWFGELRLNGARVSVHRSSRRPPRVSHAEFHRMYRAINRGNTSGPK